MLPGELHGTNVISLQVSHFRLTDTVHEPNAVAERHSHRLPQICLVQRGAFEERVGQMRREIDAFSAVVRPAGEVHDDRFDASGARCFTVEIDTEWTADFEQQLGGPIRSAVLDRGTCRGTISDLQFALRGAASERALAVEETLLGLMLRVSRSLRADAPRWLADSRDFIHAHLSETLTVERIARAAHVHPVHLARTFRAKLGETVGAYLRRTRAERARDLIARSGARLADIASQCGFADQSHMNRVLRRLYGVTPRVLRR